jgi:multisubunit Na+/H+ antiporter MnhE subunit
MVTSREITYTEGALMIDMTQRSTGKLAFRSMGLDQDVTGADGSEEQIQKTVEKLLQELP